MRPHMYEAERGTSITGSQRSAIRSAFPGATRTNGVVTRPIAVSVKYLARLRSALEHGRQLSDDGGAAECEAIRCAARQARGCSVETKAVRRPAPERRALALRGWMGAAEERA